MFAAELTWWTDLQMINRIKAQDKSMLETMRAGRERERRMRRREEEE